MTWHSVAAPDEPHKRSLYMVAGKALVWLEFDEYVQADSDAQALWGHDRRRDDASEGFVTASSATSHSTTFVSATSSFGQDPTPDEATPFWFFTAARQTGRRHGQAGHGPCTCAQ